MPRTADIFVIRPRWATPLVSAELLPTGISIAGRAGVFGKVGETVAAQARPSILLPFLAFTLGLQNAAVASTQASGGNKSCERRFFCLGTKAACNPA